MLTAQWCFTLSTQRQSSVNLPAQRQLSVLFPAQKWSPIYSLVPFSASLLQLLHDGTLITDHPC